MWRPRDIEASPGDAAPPTSFSFPQVDPSESPRSSSPELSSSVSHRAVSPAPNEAEPGPPAGAPLGGLHSFPRTLPGGAAEQPWRLSGSSPDVSRRSFNGARSLLSETDPLLPQGPGTPSAKHPRHHNGNGSCKNPNCSCLRMPLVNAWCVGPCRRKSLIADCWQPRPVVG